MKRFAKKAFTLVELLVVIAIIAILAVAGVVGYMAFTKKAEVNNDTSLVAELNNYVAAMSATDKINTPTDVRNMLIEDGIDLATLKLSSIKQGYVPGFDVVAKKFVLIKDNALADGYTAAKNADVFAFAKTEAEANALKAAGFSLYLQSGYDKTSIDISGLGLDVGENTSISTVNYTGTTGSNDVVIRSNGDQCILTISAANDNVDYYGFAKEINVVAVKGESLHIFGSTAKLSVTSGHVAVEDTGIVFELATNTGSVTNNGYIAEQTSGTAPTGTAVGGDYEINSLARLEAFRDAVNAGNDFAGREVKLTSNITLKEGWRPIGEGNRSVQANNTSASGTYFRGTFNGNGKTITGLNNKGFIPTASRYDSDKGYAYGLFALVGDGAIIKDLTLKEVRIDTTLTEEKGDSVAALVGYAEGSVTISGITVEGSVKGYDAIAGVLGRAYAPAGQAGTKNIINVNVSNCVNKATVETTRTNGGKAAGIIGIAADQSSNGYNELHLSVTGCSNTGTITTHVSQPLDGDVNLVCYVTLSNNNGRSSVYTHD